ncbi:unnamed protein product [Lymnaea stagnalis]|uniref:Centriolin n=1 Tax=Lymnaea stagnalis TaxID=6523 RepID=A0AAV2IKJ1_LYMST
MNKKGSGKIGSSNLPTPTMSRGILSNLRGNGNTDLKKTQSAEDIPKQTGSKSPASGMRRAVSPGEVRRKSLLSPVRPFSQASGPQSNQGVRYITEDLIMKIAKVDNFDSIATLNLTLSKEGGKKIKYIENLDKLRKLQTLVLSYNIIEKMERMDKLLRLRDLNLSNNMIVKIEGIENLISLQSLNVNDNQIEHIPQWLPKKLKALRKFRIARNKLASLNEVCKLKPLPDLVHLDVAGNPFSDLAHCTLYIVFHIRTIQILDGQSVDDTFRKRAQERFALDEVEQLEKKLEEGEIKYKKLETSHSKSLQERSIQETSHNQFISKERDLLEKMKHLEQELAAKDDLLRKKTSDLNKASQKHYQLEQELAFYKIDSKFDSLYEAPRLQADSADDSSDLQESPYIGKARFRANKFAQEISVTASPQKAQLHNLQSPQAGGQHSITSPVKDQIQKVLDIDLERKQAEVQKTEEKLKALQSDLSNTEKKLLNATVELKKLAPDRFTPEPFRDDSKYKIRQRLARKMQRVNELRDSSTQMETAIDRKHAQITHDKNDLDKLKSQLKAMDENNPNYERKHKEMLDKESQVSVSAQKESQLKQQLEETRSNINQETADIKKLEQQLTADQIEQNEELRQELDDIVSGLAVHLENVKGQSHRYQQDIEMLSQEKQGLEEKIRHIETNLHKVEAEANNARRMQARLTELEDSLRKTEDLNSTLQEQMHRSKQSHPELQERLQKAENEAQELRQTLIDTEKTAEAERKVMQKQLQLEKERAEKMTQKIQDVNRQELETKKLMSQLEAAKALNAGLRDQVDEFRHKQMEDGEFKPSDLKKRLKKFTHDFKSNKHPIQPQGKNDILGHVFQDLQKHAQEQINTSAKELENLKKYKDRADAQIQTLKEQIKKTEETITSGRDHNHDSMLEDENKKLQEELVRLKRALEDAKKRTQEGAIPVHIVYRPDSDNGDRASSLNSDEKLLFDELQKELLDLKRNMRHHENDLSKKLIEAETEAAHWKKETKEKEREYEAEMEGYRQATELMREKQEARIQVIAQDLDQAQFVAEALQGMLEAREKALNEEFSNVDMSNMMISAQEDELAKLYDILDKQRDEIENLNQMLDHLAQQGPDGVGAAFDDELWRIRQEVNNLKETLAMQSAYVQAMPGVGTMGTQAGNSGTQAGNMGTQSDGFFQEGGHTVRGPGTALGIQAGVRPFDSTHWNISQHTPRSKVSGSQVTTTGSTVHTSFHPNSANHSDGATRTGSVHVPEASVPLPRHTQNVGMSSGPRVHPVEHLGTERRESKAPPGGKSAVGRQGDLKLPARATDTTGVVNRGESSRHNSRSRVPRALVSSAFEPVHRPEPYHPYQSPPPRPATVPVPARASFSVPLIPPPNSGDLQTYGPNVYHHFSGQPHAVAGQSGAQAVAGQGGAQAVTGGQGLPGSRIYYDGTDGGGVPQFNGYNQPVYRPSPGMMHQGNDPTVAFNPVPVQFIYNTGSSLDGYNGPQAGGSGNYHLGYQTYQPSGPAQLSHYGPGRMYVPAGAGHQGQHPARIYYSAQQPLPMPAPGGAPPPPPGAYAQIQDGGQRAPLMTPVAAGTPIKDNGVGPVVYYDGSVMMVPPSPIRPVSMDAHPRGILKHGGVDQTGNDDSYLFCNVPEHHDLEDYISELQETIKKLKMRLSKEKDFQEESILYEDRKTIKKLLNELEDRREELEGLDLAIERQKRNLKDMKSEEKELKRDRKDAHNELELLRKKNEKKILIRRRRAEDDSFDEAVERSRIKYLTDELHCLERTLAKRHAQLKDTERKLRECNTELKDAKEQARDTIKQYNDATNSLHQALREHQEIEKRSNDVAVELVKASDHLVILKADVKDMERKKNRQEKLLRDIKNIIAKKDADFKEVDGKVKRLTDSLQRLEADVAIHGQREKEMVHALRDSEDVLAKRRAEIQRLKDQIEHSKQELEKLDQQVGRKKTEIQLFAEAQERKQQEFNRVLQDAESDIAARHREIKDCHDDIDNLNHQKADLSSHLKTKRVELQKLKEEIEQEEEVLQRLMNNVNKNKSELKHTFEMQKLEQTELDSVKAQHSQKLLELERTQRALLEEKTDLEQLNAETVRKSADLERLRQAIERERLEVDQLNNEKQNLDDRIAMLTRDRDLLEENYKNLDEKLNTMRRNQRAMEEKMDSTSSRLEIVEAELRVREREMEDAEIQREAMQKDIQSLKQNIKESKQELKILQDTIREAEDQMSGLDQDVRNTFHQRDQAKLELEHLNEQIRHSSVTHEEHSRQEKTKYKELQDLLRTLSEREMENQETSIALNKLRKDVEKEETRLIRLVDNANSDLQLVREELTAKQEELEAMKTEYTELQKNTDEMQYNKDKCLELNKVCQILEQDLRERTVEKTELAKALSTSYDDVQKLQKEAFEMQEKMTKERSELENALRDLQENLEQTKQEVKQVENRSFSQVTELQTLAEKHFNRANSLEAELSQAKKEVILTKAQLASQAMLNKQLDDMYNALNWSREDLNFSSQYQSWGEDHPQTLIDETFQSNTQHSLSDASPENNKENISAVELIFGPDDKCNLHLRDKLKKSTLRERLAEEQDYLRFQLRQQMLRHSETMESARLKSDETIDCLRRKLNALQEVLFNTNPKLQNISQWKRARSRSPAYKIDAQIRHRSPSPNDKSGRSYFIQRRSRSSESLDNSLTPERDFL